MKGVKGYTLRPPVCSCDKGCVSKVQMQARHGTPDQFTDALGDAYADGFITFDEAQAANIRYRREWAHAPESTTPRARPDGPPRKRKKKR